MKTITSSNADEFKPYMKLNASSLETDKEEIIRGDHGAQ